MVAWRRSMAMREMEGGGGFNKWRSGGGGGGGVRDDEREMQSAQSTAV